MLALAHYDPQQSHLFGVWLPPVSSSGEARAFYPQRSSQVYAEQVMALKGPNPSWEEWFANLAESTPVEELWVAFEVPPGTTPVEAFQQAPRPARGA